MLAAALGAVLVLTWLAMANPVVQGVLARFDDVSEDSRWRLWELASPMVPQYFPWGSGLGSFVPAYAAIEPLDAIEWTPQAGIETGGHRRWHDMYRRILAAGKSVQIVNVEPHEVQPLLDTLGRKGVYLLIQFKDEREAEQILELVGDY